jgi:4-carboxymuconolactone decarboxylase
VTEPVRLPLIGDDTDDPLLQALFDRTRTSPHGRIPNLYRTLGHSPEMLDAWITFAWSLRADPVTPRSLRELVIVRIATIIGSAYELAAHRPMALDAGCGEAQVEQIGNWQARAELYADDELAALAVADRIATGDAIDPDEWSSLRSHFDERACVEIALTASFYVCVGRILDALAVPLETDR